MPPPKPRVTLLDDALPRARFLTLLGAVRRLGRERLRAGYQTTFWFDPLTPPSNLVEQAVLTLWPRIPSSLLRGVTGVEWWLSRMRTSNVKVDFHRDRDNALFARTGRERRPVLSSVLYLNRCRGGLLAVTDQPPNPGNPALAPDVHDFDLVAPGPNRYVYFDAGLTHGVLDARNRIPLHRLPTERRWRLAVAINYWDHRPEQVGRFEASPHYRSLKLRAPPAPRGRARRDRGA